jgi:hypothetical protein
MKYKKSEAKEYARENFRGVWAATMTPFDDSLAIDDLLNELETCIQALYQAPRCELAQ